MHELIELIIENKEKHNDESFEKIVDKLKYLMLYHLKKFEYREDKDEAHQELLITLLEVINKFKVVNYCEFEDSKTDRGGCGIVYYNRSNDAFVDLDFNSLEINERQFIKYVNIAFKRKSNYLLKRINKNKERIEIVDIDIIDLLQEDRTCHNEQEIIDLDLLSDSNREFLSNFIENGKILNQSDVAKKLGITQQAVSKRWLKIKNKIVVVKL